MNFWQAAKSGFSNYANFSGRAVRSEYWLWILFAAIVGAVAETLDITALGYHPGPFILLWDIVSIVPNIAVGVRRLHDTDRTGWWMLLMLTGIGVFVLIYWQCLRGTPGPNRFGPDPFAAGELNPRLAV